MCLPDVGLLYSAVSGRAHVFARALVVCGWSTAGFTVGLLAQGVRERVIPDNDTTHTLSPHLAIDLPSLHTHTHTHIHTHTHSLTQTKHTHTHTQTHI